MAGVTGKLIAAAARQAGCEEVVYVPEKAKVVGELVRLTRAGRRAVDDGRGDVVRFGEEFLAAVDNNESVSPAGARGPQAPALPAHGPTGCHDSSR